MFDRREEILARMRVIIEGIEGLSIGPGGIVRGVGRNREDISGPSLPAIVLHDGSEEARDGAGRGPRRSAQQLMDMHPQFVILLGKPTEEIGAQASLFRARLITALLNDATIIDLIGGERGNGDIRYDGLEFDSAAGETREGRLTMHFTVSYVFKAGDLAA